MSAKYRTTEDLIIDIVVYTVMIIVMIATLYPFGIYLRFLLTMRLTP